MQVTSQNEVMFKEQGVYTHTVQLKDRTVMAWYRGRGPDAQDKMI